jgi:type IV pilus modification protein PilV
MPARWTPKTDERGMSLVETLIALVVLSVGILAMARLFPSATRSQEQSKMTETAAYYAQERMERLSALSWSDTALSAGRHPGGIATENLGATNAWHRYYNVTGMAAPLSDLKKVTVTVTWNFQGSRSTSTTTYLRR